MTKAEKEYLFRQCKQADIDSDYYRRQLGVESQECQHALTVWATLMNFIDHCNLNDEYEQFYFTEETV